uniref:Complement component 1 Q subcomponent-binding protein, mitochondrial n=1 Tax=Plectus sambesii TaxID=2011161 RepID=A0A914X1L5_9BILA
MDGMEEFEQEGQQAHDDQGNLTPVSRPLFTVEIEKGNERLCFELELVDAHDEHGQFDYRVEEFYIAPTGSGEIDPKVYSSSGKYIDENLYNLLFLKFLEERGIDAQFCENLVRFSTHYEHAQYVALLQKIKSFVSK